MKYFKKDLTNEEKKQIWDEKENEGFWYAIAHYSDDIVNNLNDNVKTEAIKAIELLKNIEQELTDLETEIDFDD